MLYQIFSPLFILIDQYIHSNSPYNFLFVLLKFVLSCSFCFRTRFLFSKNRFLTPSCDVEKFTFEHQLQLTLILFINEFVFLYL